MSVIRIQDILEESQRPKEIRVQDILQTSETDAEQDVPLPDPSSFVGRGAEILDDRTDPALTGRIGPALTQQEQREQQAVRERGEQFRQSAELTRMAREAVESASPKVSAGRFLLQRLMRGGVEAATRAPAGLLQMAGDLFEDPEFQTMAEAIGAFGEAGRLATPVPSNQEPGAALAFAGDVAEAAPQFATQIGASIAGQALGIPAPLTFAATAAGPVIADKYVEAKTFYVERGYSERDAAYLASGEALTSGLITGVVNKLGGEKVFRNPLWNAAQQKIKQIAGRIATSAVVEGATEFGENTLSDLTSAVQRFMTTGDISGLERMTTFDYWLEKLREGAIGVALGGTAGPVTGVGQPSTQAQETTDAQRTTLRTTEEGTQAEAVRTEADEAQIRPAETSAEADAGRPAETAEAPAEAEVEGRARDQLEPDAGVVSEPGVVAEGAEAVEAGSDTAREAAAGRIQEIGTDIRSAFRMPDGRVISGEKGELHNALRQEGRGLTTDEIAQTGDPSVVGFVDASTGNFLSIQEIDGPLSKGRTLSEVFRRIAAEAAEARVSMADVVAGRVTETEATGERPPTIERAEGEPSPEGFTSARRVDMDRDRASFGMDTLPSPERQSWQNAIDKARREGIPEKAIRIAHAVNETPRALSDIETAGLVDYSVSLKNEHQRMTEQIGKTDDAGEIATLAAEIQRVESEFDQLSRALRSSGTEKGRALAAQKLTIDQDFRLISVLNRAKAAKGASLTQKQRKTFEELTAKLKAESDRVSELESKIRDLQAQRAVRQTSRRRGKPTPQHTSELYAKARRLIEAGCHNN